MSKGKRAAPTDSSLGFILPYKKLSPEQKAELEQIMREGSRVLSAIHLKVRANKRRMEGNPKFSYCRRDLRAELFKQVGTAPRPVAIAGVLITKDEVAKIFAIRCRETQILEGYSNLIRKIVFRKANPNTNGAFISIDDCCEEGCMALIDAAYHYTKNPKDEDGGSSFTTFAFWSVFRRITRVLNRSKKNFPWSIRMRELYQLYQNAQQEMNRPANFQDVVDFMGLGEDDRIILQTTLVQVIAESDGDGDNDEQMGIRYAACEQPITLDHDEIDVFSAANLTPWEQAVFVAYLSGHHGWQTEVASQHINPATGEPYSKPAVKLALKRTIEKLKIAHKKGAVGNAPFLGNFFSRGEEVA